jgi:ribosomal-protein-alanine N-acetyltransferase
MSAVVKEGLPMVRSMREQDLPAVLEVERAAYEFPWTLGIFRDCLTFGYTCRVYQNARGLIGHGIMSVGAGECHMLNICVHPAYQRRGLGVHMVRHLMDLARAQKARSALLEVRSSNFAAYQLYTQIGFNEIGIRKGYYPAHNGREDAVILACEL